MTANVNEWLFQSPQVELMLHGHRVMVIRANDLPLMVPIIDSYGEIPEHIFKDYIQKPGVDRMRILRPAATFDEVIDQLNNEILFMFSRYHDQTFCRLLGWRTSPSGDFTAWPAPIRLVPEGDSAVFSGLVYAAY